jgi:hypothetical protein
LLHHHKFLHPSNESKNKTRKSRVAASLRFITGVRTALTLPPKKDDEAQNAAAAPSWIDECMGAGDDFSVCRTLGIK